jgi:sulfatase maturation enzyme AslB (radical SAM superfamily)
MSNKFCKLLSNGYKIDVVVDKLLWSPCCLYSKKTPLLDQKAFQSALEYSSNATGWLPECNVCKNMEQAGQTPRQTSSARIARDLAVGECGSIELSFDTKCNAACLSCGAWASSTWRKYDYKHQLNDHGPEIDRSDELLQQIINNINLDNVQHIYILGGEPFFSSSNLKFLQHLHKNHTNLNEIVLKYQTNGSVTPEPEVIELWGAFKQVEVSFSIDGVGERFDYLRWPLKWDRVEKNIKYLLEATNVKFEFNATISPLSILYFNEIEKWVSGIVPKSRILNQNMIVRPNRCFNPLNLDRVTPELGQAIIKKYGADHLLSGIINNIGIGADYDSMFEYINTHDQLRRLNWRTTFPDILPYYKDMART